MNLTEQHASDVANSLLTRHAKSYRLIDNRQAHISMRPEVAPRLAEPLARPPAETYQSDEPRQAHVELLARLTGNHCVISCSSPSDSGKYKTNSENLENVLNAFIFLNEERAGFTLQHGLSDGQVGAQFGVLAGRRTSEEVGVPEHEWTDELPEDTAERARYDSFQSDRPEGKGKGYRETEKSRSERHARRKAYAGSAYVIETIKPETFAFVPDRKSKMARAMTFSRVDIMDYNDELEGASLKERVGMTSDSKLRVYRADSTTQGLLDAKTKSIIVAELWTRDEWYELACDATSFSTLNDGPANHAWVIVRSGTHDWGRPPFVLVPANFMHTTELHEAYTTVLEGMFRLKPAHDRRWALLEALQEKMALGEKIIERAIGSEAITDDQGAIRMANDSAGADTLPEGWKITEFRPEVSKGFVDSVAAGAEEYHASRPQIALDDVGASTQPWTLRLTIEQRGIAVHGLIDMQAWGIRDLIRMVVKDMVAQDREFCAFKVSANGEQDPRTVVSIHSRDIEGLIVNCKIDSVSASERITVAQHGLDLWKAGVITLRQLLEEYFAHEDPIGRMKELQAEQEAKPFISNVIKQKVGARWGAYVVMGRGGELLGPGGQVMTPEQAFALKGIQPPFPGPQQPGAFTPPGGGGGSVGMNGAGGQMGDLGGPQPQGVIPLPALAG